MSSTTSAPAAATSRQGLAAFATRWSSQIGITVAFLLLWLVFIIAAPATFLSDRIYLSFAQTTPYFALVAMPLTMVIISGDIDLSFPSIMALGMVGFVWTWDATGSVALAIIATLMVGVLAGLFNGIVVTRVGIPSLVVTIGTQFLFRGLAFVLVAGKSTALVATIDSPAYDLMVGKVLQHPDGILLAGARHHRCVDTAQSASTGPERLRDRGQSPGGQADGCAHRVGPGSPCSSSPVSLLRSLDCSTACRWSISIPAWAAGYLLPTLAAVFVGGTSVFGGRGSVWGTFIGAFMIGGITAGIVAVGLTDFYTNLIYGAVILISVSIHAILQRRFER